MIALCGLDRVIPIVGIGPLGGTSEGTKALDEASQIGSRIPESPLRQKAGPRDCVRWHAKPDHGLTAHDEFFAGTACGFVAALELLTAVIKTPHSKTLGSLKKDSTAFYRLLTDSNAGAPGE